MKNKNDSEQSLVFTGNCNTIKIKENKTLIYNYIKKSVVSWESKNRN